MSSDICIGREETVHRFLDDELSPTEREEFITHLQACAACQTLLNELQALFIELESLENLPIPFDVTAQVMDRLPQPATRPAHLRLGWLALAGQIVVGLVLLLLVGPMLLPVIDDPLLWQPWVEITTLAISLRDWLADWLVYVSAQAEAWAATGPATFSPTLSPDLAGGLILVLSLAWLVGNGLLLRRYLSTPKNGGVL